MLDDKQATRVGKFLCRHLRHKPEAIGLSLAPGGWVPVESLLSACNKAGICITREDLDGIVVSDGKQRYSYDESGRRIRANQGHSTEVDLELVPQVPPPVLFHGTGEKSAAAILKNGLLKMRRHHVHLSVDEETARCVGARHGRPMVFRVDAAAMAAAGTEFYCSSNGVWLVDRVPPAYLSG